MSLASSRGDSFQRLPPVSTAACTAGSGVIWVEIVLHTRCDDSRKLADYTANPPKQADVAFMREAVCMKRFRVKLVGLGCALLTGAAVAADGQWQPAGRSTP